jgi:hypothetical protein
MLMRTELASRLSLPATLTTGHGILVTGQAVRRTAGVRAGAAGEAGIRTRMVGMSILVVPRRRGAGARAGVIGEAGMLARTM